MTWLAQPDGIIASGWLSSAFPGHGILGAAISTGGDHPGAALNDGIDPGAEYRWRVNTWPDAGDLRIYEDLSFVFDADGIPAGIYPWVYELFENGMSAGTATVTITAGNPVISVDADVSDAFAIRAAVDSFFSDGWYLLAQASAELNDGFSIAAATQSVHADLSDSWYVAGQTVQIEAPFAWHEARMTEISFSMLYNVVVTPPGGAPFLAMFDVYDGDPLTPPSFAADGALRVKQADAAGLVVGSTIEVSGKKWRVAADPRRIGDGRECIVALREI